MREVNGTMKYQIEKAVADIGVKVFFGSVEGVDNTGRDPEWEAERKVRLENLQKCMSFGFHYIDTVEITYADIGVPRKFLVFELLL